MFSDIFFLQTHVSWEVIFEKQGMENAEITIYFIIVISAKFRNGL